MSTYLEDEQPPLSMRERAKIAVLIARNAADAGQMFWGEFRSLWRRFRDRSD